MRKRLASHFDGDSETAVRDHKRIRRCLNAGAGLTGSTRSCVGTTLELLDSAGEAHNAVASTIGHNMASGVVKRGRGRPRKVSSFYNMISCGITSFITALVKCLMDSVIP